MKRFYKFLMPVVAIVAMALPWTARSQELGDYTFSTGVDATKWVPMTGATQILSPSANDGLASSVQTIPFSFPFGEDVYTQYSVNTDGNLRLGSTVTGTGSYSTPFSSTNANTNSPKINAFGCDGYGTGSHYVKALNQGDTLLVVEFCMGTYTSDTRNMLYKWQIHLYSDGDIEIVFPDASGIPATAPAVAHQCGLCVNSSDGWIITSADSNAVHFTAGSSSTNASGTWFDANRYYRFERPVITCPKPAMVWLTDVTANDASISWLPGGTESDWRLYLNDSLLENVVSDTFYVLDNLTPYTTYEFSIVSLCDESNGDTSLARVLSFTTPCSYQPLPYTIDFDSITTSTTAATGAAVPCWDYVMLNPSYASASYLPQVYYSSSNANSGSYSLRLYGTSYTILPPMEAPIDSLQIMFSHYTSSTTYKMQVGAIEADGTFVPLATIDDPTTHVDHTIYLNNYTGTSHTLAFFNYYSTPTSSTGYSYHYIDDIYVDYMPTCSPVTDLEVEASVGSAVVSWTAGTVGTYTGAYVEYRPDTAAEWTAAYTESEAITLTGLEAATTYIVRVKSICDADDSARLWATATFATRSLGCAEMDPSTLDTLLFSNSTSSQSGCMAYSSYGNTVYQTIYTAAELLDSGLTAGPITGIDLGFSPSSSYAKEFTIFLGNSTTTSISNATIENPNQQVQVYGPAPHPTGTTGWQHYDFAEPFVWDGVSSIIMTTFMNQPAGVSQSSSSGLAGYYVSASNKARYRYKDSNPFTLSDYNSGSGGSNYSYRAAIHFYSGVCMTQSTCAEPAVALSSIDTTSATITWVPGYQESSWEIWYRQGSSGNFIVADYGVTNMQYQFQNLQPGTEYTFRVVNICGNDTLYSELSAFTDCAPIDYMFDDFESYATGSSAELNPCWTKGQAGTTTAYPYISTNYNHHSLYFYGYNYNNGSTQYYDWLVLPEMRDSLNVYEVEFEFYKYNTTSANYFSRIIIGAVENPNDITGFDTIAVVNADIAGLWTTKNVSLENYHGTGKHIVLYVPSIPSPITSSSYGYNYVYIDDLYVGRRSSCPKPTRFHARDITASSAELAWDAVEDYQSVVIKYNTVDDITSATEMTVSDVTAQLSGLSANTTYYCWMTAFCTEDSSRSVSCSFTTTNECNPVVDLTVTEVTTDFASIIWNSDNVTPASSYTFEWKEADSTNWNSVTTTNTYYQLTGLNSNTNYDVRVIASCDDDVANATTTTFTTPNPGTIGNNEGTYYLPTYPYYNYSISEQLWTASELASYGDTINGIYFNAASSVDARDMRIWVLDTTLADLSTSSYVPSTAMTLVADTTIDIVAGWNYFPFDNPYVRDLSKNLVVLVYDNTGSYESFNGFYATTSATNSLYAYQDDDEYSTTDLSELDAAAVKSMIRLDATMVQPTCLAPHPVVSGTTDNSISLTWIAGLNETSWSVEYRGLADTVWTVAAASTTNTSYTISGLSAATSYIFRIGALCTGNTSFATIRGTTACGTFTVPYVEDFNVYSSDEYDFDPCWFKGNTINTSMPYIVNVTNVGPDMLMPMGSYVIFPQMNVPVNQLQLRVQFLVAREDIYALVGVCSHPTDILSFTVIDTLWGPELAQVNWNTIPFDSYTGEDGYIAIYSSYQQSYIDNVNIEMIPQCGVADSITLVSATATSADLTWQAGNNGASYLVEYYALTGTDNTPDTVTTTNTSVSLTGLQPNTTYAVNIFTICPSLSAVSNVASARFNTECAAVTLPYFENFDNCNAPALTATGILPNCWNYMFTSNNTSYNGASYIPQLYSGTTYTSSGQYSLRTYGQAIITLPEMPVDVNQLRVSFHDYFSSLNYYGIIIGVCDSNWGDFEQSFVALDTIYGTSSSINVETYKLALYTGSGRYIALKNFYYYNNYNYAYGYNYIDDITVDYLPSCLPVTGVVSTGNTPTSVTIDWTDLSTSSEWIVSYSTSQLSDPMTGTTDVVSAHPYTINGLSDTASYYVYVRSVCSATDSSEWVSFGPIRPGTWIMRSNQTDTLYMCGGVIYDDGGPNANYSMNQDSYIILRPNAPGNLVSINGTARIEGYSWDNLFVYDGEGTSGTALVSLVGSSFSSGTTVSATSSSGPLTIYFTTDGSSAYSGFELNVSCISASCMITNLSVDTSVAPSSTQLALTWDTNGADSYQIEYGAPGFSLGTGTALTSNTNSIVITGLTALTNYEVYVRSLCPDNDTGSWASRVFQTPMCDNAVEILNYVDTVQSAATSSYSPIGYSTYNYSYVQTIIPAERLTDIAGEINAFAFNTASTSAGSYFTNVTVWMANVTEDNLSAGYIHPDSAHTFIKVIDSADFTYTTTGWQLHGFDTTFVWDGTSNILLAVHREHGTWASGSSFVAHVDTVARMRYSYQDSGPYDYTSITSGTASTTVGDVKFISCGASCKREEGKNGEAELRA